MQKEFTKTICPVPPFEKTRNDEKMNEEINDGDHFVWRAVAFEAGKKRERRGENDQVKKKPNQKCHLRRSVDKACLLRRNDISPTRIRVSIRYPASGFWLIGYIVSY